MTSRSQHNKNAAYVPTGIVREMMERKRIGPISLNFATLISRIYQPTNIIIYRMHLSRFSRFQGQILD